MAQEMSQNWRKALIASAFYHDKKDNKKQFVGIAVVRQLYENWYWTIMNKGAWHGPFRSMGEATESCEAMYSLEELPVENADH